MIKTRLVPPGLAAAAAIAIVGWGSGGEDDRATAKLIVDIGE